MIDFTTTTITVDEIDPTVLTSKLGREGRSLSVDIATSEDQIVLEVHTSHDKDRKTYRTTLFAVRLSECQADGRFAIRGFNLPEGVSTFARVAAGARFSAKNLDTAHRAALDSLSREIVLRPEWFETFLSHAPRD